MPNKRSVLLLGPPGVGKSTIGRLASAALNLRFMNLDDFVRPVYDPADSKRPMKDAEVDQALENLLNACRPGDLIEFSHHDYHSALSLYEERFNEKPMIALLIAQPTVCDNRNSQRKSPVPRRYVSRCIQSSQKLASEVTDSLSSLCVVLETDQQKVEVTVDLLIRFINSGR